MDLPDKILIVGLGATGVAVAKFLSGRGKQIGLADEKSETELAPTLRALAGISYTGHFGPHRKEDFLRYSMIVLSPGVDSELPVLKEARQKKIRIIGEIELASMFISEPIIAITGTNGKTTTTTLIGEIFRKAFGNVFVGGNIGNPLINYVIEGKPAPYIILEISSFQLETIETFRPNTAILLNITEDHLDRYRSYGDYKDAKYRVFENQTEKDYAIINTNVLPVIKGTPKVLPFSTRQELSEGAFARNGNLYVRLKGRETVYQREISPLLGVHNTENILTALLTAHIYDIGRPLIEDALKSFKGLPHRVEHIRTIKGIRFYNDSKATNVDATRRALESIDGKIILIAGGKDKGGSYRAIGEVADRIKSLIVIGEAKEKILKELGGTVKTYAEGTMEGAVKRAYEVAQSGDMVLLSPMCSSFDMFKDYKDRGNRFRKIVESL
ncbi:MAG TPA: UDP-N-acetylmuramoyl-L-alanine--D-glutamate ligase [Syntrophorhabdaceae bacterium]|nr:UDP-N-acetylmuramoyl-L-alanine--D-glutamate ligase [Syntrophorhabdaceae bacterium]